MVAVWATAMGCSPSPAPLHAAKAPLDAGPVPPPLRDARATLPESAAPPTVPPAVVGADGGEDTRSAPQRQHPFHAPLPSVRELDATAPARRLADLSAAACRAEAARRKLPVRRDRRPTPGVATAFRLTGPLRGVAFVTAGARSPFGVLDCRLALLFDEMAATLVEHRVEAVLVGTIYRRGSKLGRRTPSQHAHGLAADVVGFRLADGTSLSIERDWSSSIGEPACGPESGAGVLTDNAVALRNLVCDLHGRGFFHHVLTPGYDTAHRDHLHLDIKRASSRSVIR